MTQPDAPAPAEHSPTPWSAVGGIILDADRSWIGKIIGERYCANTTLVLRAVNAYEPNQHTIAALVEALEPFAKFADALNDIVPDDVALGIFCDGAMRFGPSGGVSVGKLRDARAALALARKAAP